jgi:hypothetical protein
MADSASMRGLIRFSTALALMLLILVVLVVVMRPGEDVRSIDPTEAPAYLGQIVIEHGGDTLTPFALGFHADTLWVAFQNDSRVAGLDTALRVVRWVALEQAVSVPPLTTGWAVDSMYFYRANHTGGAVEVFDREGRLQHRWDQRPDGQPLLPFALDLFAGNLYVGDVASGRVLAISMRNDTPFTEVGELMLTIPGFQSQAQPFGFISGVTCTPDGRVLIADSDPPGIRVYTCDGRSAYSFTQDIAAPLGARDVAFDRVRFADLTDTTQFDPANTAGIGRLHVVDSRRNLIYVYDPYGALRFTYGSEEHLDFPNGIVADPKQRRIVVADTGNRRLVTYRW